MMYTEVKIIENFCESLREHPMKVINFEKKKMIPLTNEKLQLFETFEHKYTNDKNHCTEELHIAYVFMIY